MNRRKSLGVGSVSLILIFCVLCLTIFALLTLSSARSENELTKKLAESVESYYAADARAIRAYSFLAQSLSEGELPTEAEGLDFTYTRYANGLNVYFLSPIDNNRSISVNAIFTRDGLEILQWSETENVNWVLDESLPVLYHDEDS